jgi:hypothetical protein
MSHCLQATLCLALGFLCAALHARMQTPGEELLTAALEFPIPTAGPYPTYAEFMEWIHNTTWNQRFEFMDAVHIQRAVCLRSPFCFQFETTDLKYARRWEFSDRVLLKEIPFTRTDVFSSNSLYESRRRLLAGARTLTLISSRPIHYYWSTH